MIKEIITNEEKLSVVSDEVDIRKQGNIVREIVLNLKDTIRKHNLTGLSAIQIGEDKRVFVINFNGTLKSFVNPMISSVKGIEVRKETCSSIPEKKFIITRYNRIQIIYQTPLGEVKSTELVGMSAMVFQHLVDHLDGILVSDHGLEIDNDFENASDEEKSEVIKLYLDSLDIKQKQLEKEITEDEDLSAMKYSLDLREKIAKGEITLVKKEEDNA